MKPTLSVIIATKNRPDDIVRCIRSLTAQTLRGLEIIIVDQSTQFYTYPNDRAMPIRHIRMVKGGKSKALNAGIANAKGKLVAFLDDDCLPDRGWARAILRAFDHHPNVDGITGRTLPFEPRRHHGLFPLSTMESNTARVVSKPALHWKHIGNGNNMAFTRSSLRALRGFNPMLGPGTWGATAEDADILLRAMLSGYSLYYAPQAFVFHNRWVTYRKYHLHQARYACGEIACYGYFALLGFPFAKKIVRNSLWQTFRPVSSFSTICWRTIRLMFQIRGALTAGWQILHKGKKTTRLPDD